MPWSPPPPPLSYPKARIAYWRTLLTIPEAEPAAALLRSMAAHRLFELGALSDEEVLALRGLLAEHAPVETAGPGGTVRH